MYVCMRAWIEAAHAIDQLTMNLCHLSFPYSIDSGEGAHPWQAAQPREARRDLGTQIAETVGLPY
eukprot:362555-Chlamydomonas_euryale.AAC.13